jgi:hypothetical protein
MEFPADTLMVYRHTFLAVSLLLPLTALLAAGGEPPLVFEPNAGQTDPQVRFLARSQGMMVFFTDSVLVPVSASSGDNAVVATCAGASTPAGATIAAAH